MISGWITDEIDNLCNVEYGTRVVQKNDGGTIYPVYGGGGATFFMDTYNREDRLTIARFAMSAKCTRFVKGKFFLNDSGITLSPKDKSQIEQNFLNYQCLALNDVFYSLAKGSAQKNLDVPAFRRLKLNIPSDINLQKKIVAKLDAIFAEIDKATAAAECNAKNAEALFQSYLNEVFNREHPNQFKTTLGEYYDVRDGTHDSPKFYDEGYPLITSKNLKCGVINFDKVQHISKEDYLSIAQRSAVKKGDVLMAMIGTIGNPVVIETEREFAIKNVALFKTSAAQSPYYLRYYLSSSNVVHTMLKDAKGATQKFVGLGYLRSFPITISPLDAQIKIVKELEDYEKVTSSLVNSYNLKTLYFQNLKQSILKQAFNGELVKE